MRRISRDETSHAQMEFDVQCLAEAMVVLGDRWSLQIIARLVLFGPLRYTDLFKGLPGIATNMLADRLRRLEAAGVIERVRMQPPMPATLFHLTRRGKALRQAVTSLMRWGEPLQSVQRPSLRYRPATRGAAQSDLVARSGDIP